MLSTGLNRQALGNIIWVTSFTKTYFWKTVLLFLSQSNKLPTGYFPESNQYFDFDLNYINARVFISFFNCTVPVQHYKVKPLISKHVDIANLSDFFRLIDLTSKVFYDISLPF